MEIIYYHLESVSSTNTWAKEQFKFFPKDALVVISAENQSAGRGRFERRWLSFREKSLLATFCFQIEQGDIFRFTHLLAFSLIDWLKEQGIQGALKWPNDVIIQEKKVAGILCETLPLENRVGVVIGIGVNVNLSVSELLQIDQPATSIFVETKALFDISSLLQDLVKRFTKGILNHLVGGLP